MRSILILFFLAISFQIFAQGTSNRQRTLITKRTATWCPLCGGWGWDMAKGIEAFNNEDVFLLKAHYSGDLETQVAIDITNNWNAAYQPEFFINEEKQDVGSSTWSSKLQEFRAEIEANSKNDAKVSFDIKTEVNGNEITADVDLEFLSAVAGNYNLGIYLVEDSLVNNQAGRGSSAVHNGVLRSTFSGLSFGGSIVSGSADVGEMVNRSLTLEVDGGPIEDRHLRVLAIVWKVDGGNYQVENLHDVSVGLSASTYTSLIKEDDFKAITVGNDLELSFSLLSSMKSGRVEVYQMNGQKIISKVFKPMLDQNNVSIPVANVKGNFVVVSVIGDENLLISKKVYIE
ncbi:Omp28-related outer membrane protein [Portibacter lacus]|uniref:Omp28-related outer membrane protein n=2 Tax=Portibacter lacus TaxID=1099794 RepID=A0AA37SR61_9BACT|nr:Omp28-related outer membrane protein [Portibacter lacus]GLR16190.1 hypothetical protein GCM10007940_08050 [Portibacter lacus]